MDDALRSASTEDLVAKLFAIIDILLERLLASSTSAGSVGHHQPFPPES